MKDIILKQYTDDYYEFVYQVKKDAYKNYVIECFGTWDENIQRQYFAKFINQVKNNAYIICYKDKEIGFYNGEILEDGCYEVGNICIIKEYQGMGLGTQLLNYILEINKDRDIKIQYFKQNPVGNLYKRLGFNPYEETLHHYKMIKYYKK